MVETVGLRSLGFQNVPGSMIAGSNVSGPQTLNLEGLGFRRLSLIVAAAIKGS